MMLLISLRTLLIIAFLFFHYWKKISLRLLRAVSPWGHSSRVGALGLPMTKIPAWKVEAEKMRREGQMANIFLLNQTKWDWVYNIPIAFETKKLCLQFSDWFWKQLIDWIELIFNSRNCCRIQFSSIAAENILNHIKTYSIEIRLLSIN